MVKSVAGGEPWEGARTIEATQARQSFRDIVDEAYAAGRRVVITRHARPVAAIVAIKDFLRLRDHDKAADKRMLERSGAEDEADAAPIEGLVAAFEQHEAGNVHTQGGEVTFGQIPAEQLASDLLAQYIESPEFLDRARRFVSDLVDATTDSQSSFSAAEASALKAHLLAQLTEHGLITHSFA
jgi:prevent-host-death family protein